MKKLNACYYCNVKIKACSTYQSWLTPISPRSYITGSVLGPLTGTTFITQQSIFRSLRAAANLPWTKNDGCNNEGTQITHTHSLGNIEETPVPTLQIQPSCPLHSAISFCPYGKHAHSLQLCHSSNLTLLWRVLSSINMHPSVHPEACLVAHADEQAML